MHNNDDLTEKYTCTYCDHLLLLSLICGYTSSDYVKPPSFNLAFLH